MSNWDSEPVPERQWAIRDRVPLNQVGLFSGEGGTGKSIIELMKNVAHVAGKDWLGSLPEPGPAFYLGAEDDKDEIHIRLAAIAKHYGVTFKELIEGGLHVLPLLGKDATLCAVNPKTGKVETTALYRQIYEAAGDSSRRTSASIRCRAPLPATKSTGCRSMASPCTCRPWPRWPSGSVTILSHPSLAGIANGSGISGSTAWHGAFRFRQYLKGVKAPRTANSPTTTCANSSSRRTSTARSMQTIALRYKNGLFLPVPGVSSLEKLAREAKAEGMFMDLLRRFADQGSNVSHKRHPQLRPQGVRRRAGSQEAQVPKERVRGRHAAPVRRRQDPRRDLRQALAPPKQAGGDAS